MCGICGIRRFGDEPIEEHQINMLLMMNERRGNQATGVGIQQENGDTFIYKTDDPAGTMVASKRYKEWLKEYLTADARIVIGHTRAATQGDPRKNENNHPVCAGKTAIIHNGMISNDYVLFSSMKLERKAQVDSDIIRAILDDKGLTKEGGKALSRINGSAAIAAISPDYPGKLLLARSGSPIVLAEAGGLMIWASEKVAIHNSMRRYEDRRGVWMQRQRPDLAMSTMTNNSVYIFGNEGLEWHDEFDACRSYFQPSYDVHNTYRNNRARWPNNDEYEGVRCPNKECGKFILLTPAQKSDDLWDLICRACKAPLAENPIGRVSA